jgi:hypothetical protein
LNQFILLNKNRQNATHNNEFADISAYFSALLWLCNVPEPTEEDFEKAEKAGKEVY